MELEIERKFLFHPGKWTQKPLKTQVLDQGYLPSTGEWEVRLRRSPTECRYTMKTGSGVQRGEWEIRVSPTDFEALWPQTEGLRIQKTRSRYEWKGVLVDVDHYSAPHPGLTVAEVEFKSPGQAQVFLPPPAFGPELTYDWRYKNRALAEGNPVPLEVPGPDAPQWSYGVLPFRRGAQGWELVMVSTRRGDRWIFPKGQPEPRMSLEKVALLEAREEAGLTGQRIGHPLVVPYVRETGTINLLLFPLKVTAMASRWLEQGQRDRKVIAVDDVEQYGDLAQIGAQWIRSQWGP